MKWFHIQFSEDELIKQSDAVFVRQFITFSNSVQHPEELNLYSIKFKLDTGTAYYVSSPDEIDYKVKAILIRFNFSEVSRPNLKLLELEFGKERYF
ncbi:MAG: hypothetical protein WAU11_15220 [Ignavibacteriaceae bacterium]